MVFLAYYGLTMVPSTRKKSFNHFCANNKIKRDYTVPETSEQNGVAERYNRTVVELLEVF